ncbi:MAG TPA: tetratricopeptide repeat protein [Candidatus Acidoferrales bacterium]|nr:tetratricopeptide repeat protein [Candidatus Acidoferrales bacterium]
MGARFLLPAVLSFTLGTGWSARSAGASRQAGGNQRNLSIDGQVIFANNRPAALVLVQLDSAHGGVVEQATTDSVGRFAFTGLGSGDYEIVIDALGYRPVRQAVPLAGISANALVLTLAPAAEASRSAGGAAMVSVSELKIPAKARKEYQEGERSFDAGKMADAASHLEKAIQLYPGYNQSYMMLAAALADQGRFPQADTAIQKSLSLDPNNSRAYSYSGYVFLKEKNIPAAESAFQKAITLLDSNWVAHLEYGRLLFHEKRFTDAYPHLLAAHQNLPEVRIVHLLLYNDLIALNRRQEGLAELDDFLARFPDDPRFAQVRQMRQSLGASLAQQSH